MKIHTTKPPAPARHDLLDKRSSMASTPPPSKPLLNDRRSTR